MYLAVIVVSVVAIGSWRVISSPQCLKSVRGFGLAVLVSLAVLNLQSALGSVIHPAKRRSSPPRVTCHIATVSYRFVGEPGTEFRYDGDTWRVPLAGSIELIASPTSTTYQVDGRSLPLEVWPRDEFGTRTVPLPRIH